jgi:GST-like protein
MIELYTSPTPNGYKTSVALEELEIPYNVHAINLQKGDQKTPEFLKLNPNGRIPVIVDTEVDLTIIESGAQLIYLAERQGSFCQQILRGDL